MLYTQMSLNRSSGATTRAPYGVYIQRGPNSGWINKAITATRITATPPPPSPLPSPPEAVHTRPAFIDPPTGADKKTFTILINAISGDGYDEVSPAQAWADWEYCSTEDQHAALSLFNQVALNLGWTAAAAATLSDVSLQVVASQREELKHLSTRIHHLETFITRQGYRLQDKTPNPPAIPPPVHPTLNILRGLDDNANMQNLILPDNHSLPLPPTVSNQDIWNFIFQAGPLAPPSEYLPPPHHPITMVPIVGIPDSLFRGAKRFHAERDLPFLGRAMLVNTRGRGLSQVARQMVDQHYRLYNPALDQHLAPEHRHVATTHNSDSGTDSDPFPDPRRKRYRQG
jgi:hypothetical protein